MPPCDCALAQVTIRRHPIVSILVLVDAALRLAAARDFQTYVAVSILVLVDAALRHKHGNLVGYKQKCFNPCFSGCRPATRQRRIYNRYIQFQSLF